MNADTPHVVARTRSIRGGRCEWTGCTRPVEPGGQIIKLDVGDRGGSTKYGQGYGIWVHADHELELVGAAD